MDGLSEWVSRDQARERTWHGMARRWAAGWVKKTERRRIGAETGAGEPGAVLGSGAALGG